MKLKRIKTNSKHVKKKDIFICEEKEEYIKDALNKGVKLVITNNKVKLEDKRIKKVDDIFKEKYNIFSKLYHINNNSLKTIGITGTDGKTTTATMISELLDNCSYLVNRIAD